LTGLNPEVTPNAPFNVPQPGQAPGQGIQPLGGEDTKKALGNLQEQEQKKQPEPGPPELKEAAKEAKIKTPEYQVMMDLIRQGINPITNPQKFLEAFGATSYQFNNGKGMVRSWGPLEGLMNWLDDDRRSLKARQEGLMQVGTYLTKQLLELQAKQLGGPQTLAEAESIAPGAVRPTPDQLMEVEQPRPFRDTMGPMPGMTVANPDAVLKPFQQSLAMTTGTNLRDGSLVMSPEGIVEPTTMAIQGMKEGRGADDAMARWMDEATRTPLGQPLPPMPAGMKLPPSMMNKIAEIRAQKDREVNKGPNYNNRLESLVTSYSSKNKGRVMSVNEFAGAFPAEFERLREQAENVEPKALMEFEQDQQAKRQMRVAESVKSSQIAAEQKAPVAGDVTKYGKMSMDGMGIDKPTDGRKSQLDLTGEGYVDLSKFKNEVDAVNDLSVIKKDLAKLERYADELFTAAPGLLNAVVQGGKLTWSKLGNTGKLTNVTGANGKRLTVGELANLYSREVESMLEYYGRNLKGLRGAATEGDVNRMRQNFAGDFTSKNVKDHLFADTGKLINDIHEGAMATMFGKEAVEKNRARRATVRQMMLDGKSDDEIKKALEKMK
jgi:hypothetical protein